MYRVPQEIDYGLVREIVYLPDYGRFEAQVELHFGGDAAQRTPAQVLASVAARQDEGFEDLRLRLVLKAARLLRLVEVEESGQDAPETPMAA